MSHEITVRENGLVEAMYANDPAWHGLGEVLDEAPDSETAIKAANLDWDVEKVPMFTAIPGSHPEVTDYREVSGHYAIRRCDNRNVLGVVGERYETFANREAFKFLDSLLMDGVMRYESAFSLRGGRNVVLLARLPSVDVIGENGPGKGDKWRPDHLLRYVLLSTSHDGSAAIDLTPTSCRVECANLLNIALKDSSRRKHRFTIRHTSKLNASLKLAKKYLSLFDEKFTEHAETLRTLADVGIDKKVAREFIAALLPGPDDDATDRIKRNHERKVNAIRKAWNSPTNANLPATWYKMVNAVTYAADHSRVFNRYRGDKRKKAESRFLSLTDGRGSDLKDRALELAAEMAS